MTSVVTPKLLVTGVAGFLGRHIARHFAELGWIVLGLDVVPPENAPLASVTTYYRIELPDESFRQLIQKQRPDLCIHCAGRASVNHSVVDPAADFAAGPVMTFEVLDTLRRYAADCRFIFLSSAAVYGNAETLPIAETQMPSPLSPYGFHKWLGEIQCQEFHRIFGLPTASARIFSAYGPGLRRQVIWDICYALLTNKPLTLLGTGQESRDFIHAADIARALDVIAAKAPMQGEAYNLASGREITILELANLILSELDLNCEPQFDAILPVGTPRNWRANISKLSELGFTPNVEFESGIKMFVNWCRAELA